MTPEQVKYMVDRFLAWQLPDNFNPDGGITFELIRTHHRISNKGNVYESVRKPIGTNLFDTVQAKAMVLHMIEGLPEPPLKTEQTQLLLELRARIDRLESQSARY